MQNSGNQIPHLGIMTKSQNQYSQPAVRLGTTLSAGKAIWGAAPGKGTSPRLAATLADGSRWNYTYDAKGEVVSGAKQWSDGVPAAGEQFQYTFDDIGNRTSTLAGGDQTGANLRAATYTASSLNEYTSRTVPAAVDILGGAAANATVTVNNQATYRNAPFYEATLALTNSSAAVWQSITNLAVAHSSATTDLVATVTGNAFLQQTPEAFSYDSDGNLTRDGRWTYTWDGENRLIQMVSLTNAPVGSKLRLTFGHDSKWRRISKAVEAYNGTSWTTKLAESFVYDGWNLVDELNATNNAVIRSYMWGLDLSGTTKGAGGAGGLHSISDFGAGIQIPSCRIQDGNGNVVGLGNMANGIGGAFDGFGCFGELGSSHTPAMAPSPFAFASKYQDSETLLFYFGFRFYDSLSGNWLTRDPKKEKSGFPLKDFARNDPINFVDIYGLCPYKCGSNITQNLNETPGEISGTFANWPEAPKASACCELLGLNNPGTKDHQNAWDIIELATDNPNAISEVHKINPDYVNPIPLGTKSTACEYTVTFNGNCHDAAQVNFAQWGRMCKLCSGINPILFNESAAVFGAQTWKQFQYRESSGHPFVKEAAAFTRYGYSGTMPGPNLGLRGCKTKDVDIYFNPFHWAWEPMIARN